LDGFEFHQATPNFISSGVMKFGRLEKSAQAMSRNLEPL